MLCLYPTSYPCYNFIASKGATQSERAGGRHYDGDRPGLSAK